MKKTVLVACVFGLATLVRADPFPRIHIHHRLENAEVLLGHEPPATPETTPLPGPSSTPAAPEQQKRPEAIQEREAQESHKQGGEFQLRGFAAVSYGLNLPQPAVSRNLIRGYGMDDRKLKLDGVNLDFQYGMEGEEQIGARLDLVLGGSYPRIDAAAGLFRDAYTGRSNTDFDIRQAFVRYNLDENLTIDAGKFATWLGYEILPGVDGKNPHATPAYGYTLNPFTHTGLRCIYDVSDELTILGAVVLGADNFQDTNRSPSFGGQVNWHPSDNFSLIFNVLDGPERAYNDRDRRRYYDVVANYGISEEVDIGLYAWTSTEEGLGTAGGLAYVNGMAFYLQSQLSDRFLLNFRQEFYNDPFGIRLGAPARLRALTITPEYRFTDDWAMRVDFRFDKADRPVFDHDGRPGEYQNTVFFQQTLKF